MPISKEDGRIPGFFEGVDCMTGRRLLFSALLVLILGASSAYSSSISIQVIQHDKTQDNIRASSYVIENALFDFFFDKGFIVSNSPAANSSDESMDAEIYYQSLDEAGEGLCAYFIVVTTDYDLEHATNPNALLLSNIESVSWQLFDVKSGQKMSGGSRQTEKDIPVSRNNEKGIVNFIYGIAGEIYGSLKNR